ncbi:hypothetical protein CFC21_060069 [Triticum aestivum]|uniref:Histidine-containing phosphotransfer protein n=5 Tax=Triticinae TaxID=1648030 RepID=A0A453GYX7_AEGTS|nr:histidine-containing phosphotransfer protein 2-like [Aegilops tauschii subsp. strangulata]XP_044377442.1 histidine-containing phosphotransfer protein 2-like [Triticum aestivum]KAF7051879.1 hypothetical protein CFC21_060069 [Triticum aestivum]
MPAAALRQQLNDHVGHMYATGILDEYYQQLQLTQDEVINIFFHDADRMLNDITSLLNLPIVDFEMVGELVHQLKACNCSVGATKVNLACEHFRQFYGAKSKEGCLMALNLLRNEFYDLRGRLRTIMQLEQQICSLGS